MANPRSTGFWVRSPALVLFGMALAGVLSNPLYAQEPYEYKELEIQRNNSQNDVVNLRSAWHRDTDYWRDYVAGDNAKWQDMNEWLAKYIAGIDAQREQAAVDSEHKAARAAEAARRR